MNKLFIVLLVFLFTTSSYAQAELSPGTSPWKAQKSVNDGYKTKLGWEIKPGDTLRLGEGSRDRQSFQYIYSSPASWSQVLSSMDSDPWNDENIKYLSSDYNGMIAIIKKFGAQGKKKVGYFAYAVVGIAEMENYWVDIENAVEHGEIIPSDSKYIPEQKGLKVEVVNQNSNDKYDQLAKIKKLYDEGVLTEEEYEAEKDKILNKG